MKFTPTKAKCTDPETGKICPEFRQGFTIAGVSWKEKKYCLIQNNQDKVKPPPFCPMLKKKQSLARNDSRKPERENGKTA